VPVVLLFLLGASMVSCAGSSDPAGRPEPTDVVVALWVASAVEETRGRIGAEFLGPGDHRCAARVAVREAGPEAAYDAWMGWADPATDEAVDRALSAAYEACLDREVVADWVADLLVGQRRFVFACWEGMSCRNALPTVDEYGCIAGRMVTEQGVRGVVGLPAVVGGPLDEMGRALGSVASECLIARFDPCGRSGSLFPGSPRQPERKSARPCMPAAKMPLPIT